MILVKNLEFIITLSSFFFKIGLDYVQHRKEGFVDHKNDIRENCRNFHSSKGVNPWFLSKILKFSLSLFFLKIGLDKLYEYVRHKKQGFVYLEQNPKIVIFLKGLTPCFGQNLKFPLCLFCL